MVARLVPVMVNMVPPLKNRYNKSYYTEIQNKHNNTMLLEKNKTIICLFLCHIFMSLLLHFFLAWSKCTDYSAGLSVEINVNISVLGWNQEGPLVGYLPLMVPPAVAFHLLIHGSPFSGNDSNAKTLACMLKACLNQNGGCGEGTNKYVALLYWVGAFWPFLTTSQSFGGFSECIKFALQHFSMRYSALSVIWHLL